MDKGSVTAELSESARLADELHRRSRRLLVASVRRGAAAGLSQREISAAIGRSQPEISRLLRFHGITPLGRALERNRVPLLKLLARHGIRDVRVFGSVSRGDDTPGSDVDLLVDMDNAVGLFTLTGIEAAASKIVGAPVDLVPSDGLRDNLSEQVLADAVPL